MGKKPSRQRIALVLFPSSDLRTTNILHGILAHARQSGRWDLHPQLYSRPGIRELAQWEPQGVITTLSGAFPLELYEPLGCPVVDVGANEPTPGAPRVQEDDRAIGREAARFFISRQYRHIAMCGMTGRSWSADRRAGFLQALHEAGPQSAGLFEFPPLLPTEGVPHTEGSLAQVTHWLEQLPKPVGIFCANDNIAVWLSEVCDRLGLGIPAEVALMGVDDDPILCQIPRVPLSSIPVPGWQIGYRAAELLAGLLRGKPAPDQPLCLPSLPPVVRASSEGFAVEDAEIRRALAFIRENHGRPVGVGDVVEATGLCRRTLELRFKRTVGRTIRCEIERLNVERARDLMLSTDLKVEQISHSCGFRDSRRFGQAFRRAHGATPREYRKRFCRQ